MALWLTPSPACIRGLSQCSGRYIRDIRGLHLKVAGGEMRPFLASHENVALAGLFGAGCW